MRNEPLDASMTLPAETLLELIGAEAALVDSDGVITHCNRLFGSLLGYEPHELRGTRLGQIVSLDERAPDALLEPASSPRELVLRGRSGAQITRAFKTERAGTLRVLVGVSQPRGDDPPGRDLLVLAKLADELPFGIVSVSLDGTLLYANAASWLLLEHWKSAVGGRLDDEWLSTARDCAERRELQEIEIQVGFKTIVVLIAPVPASGYVNFIAVDATSRKRIERKLVQDSQIFESVSEAMVIFDGDGRIVEINRAFTEITGYERAEILGEELGTLRSREQDDRVFRDAWTTLQQHGEWQGETWQQRKNGEVFPSWMSLSAVAGEPGSYSRFVGLFSDISSIKQTQEKLYHMAHYDSLTGLVNRRHFIDRLSTELEQAKRHEEQVAVMFVDLDGFKLVNDDLGADTGDRLLMEVAGRIRDCVRDSDAVARMGADEFTIMIPNLKLPQNAAVVAQKIIERIAEPVRLAQHELMITASAGVAIFPIDAADADLLFQNADAAMHRAKELGRNNYQFFSADMNRRATERLLQQTRIRSGVQNREFLPYFQPQLHAQDGRVVGFEALARWQRGSDGLVSPDLFIPHAEETGLIVQIGEQILRAACDLGRRWLDEGASPGRIAVNVSARQLRLRDFPQTVARILAESSFPPRLLELELTESTFVDDSPEVLERLLELKSLGITLAIDDFGTKYSSLAYLKKLPIDRIKIDQIFVRDLPADAGSSEIATAIIAMGRSLRLEVVAEGVEHEEQAAFLRERGCSVLQGYLFSRPLAPDAIGSFLPRS